MSRSTIGKKDFAVFIINYNGITNLKDLLFRCIDSVLCQEISNVDVWFIDNGSYDNSLHIISKRYGDKQPEYCQISFLFAALGRNILLDLSGSLDVCLG